MILVTGCGPLGTGLVNALSRDSIVKCACDKDQPSPPGGCLVYDIKSSEDIARLVREVKPHKIVLTEQISSIDYCEHDRIDAMEFNTRSVRFFVDEAGKAGARVVYISSAYVFDGRKENGRYTETDKVNPLNVYAETKLMGEVHVDKSPEYLIIRLGEMYGNYQDNFAYYVYENLKYGQKIELAGDMYFSPVYVEDAVHAVKFLVERDMTGYYNVSGPERICHYDFGVKIAEVFGLDKSLIVKVNMEDLGLKVRMPRDISLDTSKIGALMKIRGSDEGLKAMKKLLI